MVEYLEVFLYNREIQVTMLSLVMLLAIYLVQLKFALPFIKKPGNSKVWSKFVMTSSICIVINFLIMLLTNKLPIKADDSDNDKWTFLIAITVLFLILHVLTFVVLLVVGKVNQLRSKVKAFKNKLRKAKSALK